MGQLDGPIIIFFNSPIKGTKQEGTMSDLKEVPTQQEGLRLPTYQSHKQVRGGKITGIERATLAGTAGEGIRVLVFGEAGGQRHKVSDSWFEKHKPERGGYFVQYENGYESYSPAEAFELGNSRLEMTVSELKASMDIQAAIDGMTFKGAEISLNHAMEAVVRRKEAVMMNTSFFSDNKEGT